MARATSLLDAEGREHLAGQSSSGSSSSSSSESEEVHGPPTVSKPSTVALIFGVAIVGWFAMFGGNFAHVLSGDGGKERGSEPTAARAKPPVGLLARGSRTTLGHREEDDALELPAVEPESTEAGPKVVLGLLQGAPRVHSSSKDGAPAKATAAVRAAGPPSEGEQASQHMPDSVQGESTEAGPKAAMGLLQDKPINAQAGNRHRAVDTLHDGNPANVDSVGNQAGVILDSWPPQHYGLPCWYQCKSGGLCENYCGPMRSCCKYGDLSDPPTCRGVKTWPVMTFHTCVTGSVKEAMLAAQNVTTMGQGEAPIHRFYAYRAQSDAEYPFANVNAGNLPGVMWYLTNEVMPRCPKRYGIIRILRVIITTRATPELFARGMNFGVRYSYDRGQCTGSNTVSLGSCNLTWNRFGHAVGCNNFRDHYPWPKADTNYPDGIWYDFPSEGKCDFPTGAWNCTWSAESAGEISIEEELEEAEPGSQYCCHGRCTNFWRHPHSTELCSVRVQQAKEVFKTKYPDLPLDLPAPVCDFDRSQFWANWREGLVVRA